MGGSNLGAEAIYHFLKKKDKERIFFLNNINEEELEEIKNKNNINTILFIIVSSLAIQLKLCLM